MKPETTFPSVTVGIPSYNEEQNLASLVESVLTQRGSFRLVRVIISCDGCTDRTEQIARKLAAEHPLIKVLARKRNQGKISTLNALFRNNRSDVLITCDADLKLADAHVIDRMLVPFRNSEAVNLVAANITPTSAETFVGRVNNAGHRLWDAVRTPVNGGNHIHNISGGATAIRGSWARLISIPFDVSSDAGYLYIMATRSDPNGFAFAKDASVLFRAADTLRDCRLMGTRAIYQDKNGLSYKFGGWVYSLYEIPFRYKARALVATLSKDPIWTVLSILLGIIVRLFPLQDQEEIHGRWNPVTSTKKAIVPARTL